MIRSVAVRPQRARPYPAFALVRRRGFTWGELSFLTAAVLINAGAITLNVLQHRQGLPLACPFRYAFGIPCPTCGTTTSLLALDRGDWLAAWSANPMALLAGLFMWGFILYAIVSVATGWALYPNRALRVWVFWLSMTGLLLGWLAKLG